MSEQPPRQLAQVLQQWDPEPTEDSQLITPEPVLALAGLLDTAPPAREAGDLLPPMWHGLYLLDATPQAKLGEDGHPATGAFLPPLTRRRRMFGGGSLEIDGGLRIGDRVQRRGRLVGKQAKRGRSGWMLITTVEYRYQVSGCTVLTETQDLLYRDPDAPDLTSSAGAAPSSGGRPSSGRPPSAEEPGSAAEGEEPGADLTGLRSAHRPGETVPGLQLRTDPRLLFRFSALTYNAHRIHYDQPFATQAEGYPGLVVHGPLLALALLELPRRAGIQVRSLRYRGTRPVFDGETVQLARVTGGPGRQQTGSESMRWQATVAGNPCFEVETQGDQ